MPGKKKILIITYYWPPSGGAGVQRWLKFTKYLPEQGWDPYILTVDPRYAEYPAVDNSLENEIHPAVKVTRTKALDYFKIFKKSKINSGVSSDKSKSAGSKVARFVRGNFFIPDPRKGWNKYALKRASELIRSENIKYIITTSPPHSTQLVGLKLKKRYPEITWIADFRDPWTDIYYYNMFYPTLPAKLIDRSYEKKVLSNCDKLSSAWPSLGKHLSSISGIPLKDHGYFPNGYDEDDFKDLIISHGDRFTITYVGTLTDQFPINTFVSSVSNLNNDKLLVRFVGTISMLQKNHLENNLGERIEIVPYSDHKNALNYMVNSSLLLLIIPDHKNNRYIISGKVFEYMRSGLPILCIGPSDSDVAKIISSASAGMTFEYNDRKGIQNYIQKIYEERHTYEVPTQYSRRVVAEQLSNFLLKV